MCPSNFLSTISLFFFIYVYVFSMANLPVDPKSILYYSHVRSPIWTSIEEFALAQVGPAREQVEEDGSYKWAAWPEEALS